MSEGMKYPRAIYLEEPNTVTICFSSQRGDGGVREIAPNVLATFDAQNRLVAIELVGDVAKEYPELVQSLLKKPFNPLALVTRP